MGYFCKLNDSQLKMAYQQAKEIEQKNPPKDKEKWILKEDTFLYKAVEYYDRYVSMPVTVALSDLKFEVEKRGVSNNCKRV